LKKELFAMKGMKNVIYMSAALGMLIYAVPQLQIGGGWSLSTVFSVAWICFALLIIAAHLHEILGVDEEARREIRRIKHMRRWQLEQFLSRRKNLMQPRK
jgi:hypothetical protein